MSPDHRVVGFMRAITADAPSRRQVTIGPHQVMELPQAAVDDLRRAHPGAVLDLTPAAVAKVFGIERPRKLSTLEVIGCPICGGAPRMTLCSMCQGAGRVYHL